MALLNHDTEPRTGRTGRPMIGAQALSIPVLQLETMGAAPATTATIYGYYFMSRLSRDHRSLACGISCCSKKLRSTGMIRSHRRATE